MTTSVCNNDKYFDFTKYITPSDMQNITSFIINSIRTSATNALKKKHSILEVSEVVAYIFSNDRVIDYVIGNIWKKNHLNALENKNDNENTILAEIPNPYPD
jgi:hypothetical protein